MASGVFGSLGRLFGLSKSKDQGNAPARKPFVTPLGTEQGKFLETTLKDRIAGRGIGLTPELTDATKSNIFSRGQDTFSKRLATIGSRQSAGGLGRSTLRGNIETQAAREQTLAEQAQALELERQSQILASGEKSTAIGRFSNLVGAEVATQNADIANENEFAQAEFLRQRGFREAADKAQQAGLLRLIQTGAGVVGGTAGVLPGTSAGGVEGGFLGGLAGLSGDFTTFAPATPLIDLGGVTETPTGSTTGGEVDLGEFADISSQDLQDTLAALGITPAQLQQLLSGGTL